MTFNSSRARVGSDAGLAGRETGVKKLRHRVRRRQLQLPDQSPELLSQSGGSTVTREAFLDPGAAQPRLPQIVLLVVQCGWGAFSARRLINSSFPTLTVHQGLLCSALEMVFSATLMFLVQGKQSHPQDCFCHVRKGRSKMTCLLLSCSKLHLTCPHPGKGNCCW